MLKWDDSQRNGEDNFQCHRVSNIIRFDIQRSGFKEGNISTEKKLMDGRNIAPVCFLSMRIAQEDTFNCLKIEFIKTRTMLLIKTITTKITRYYGDQDSLGNRKECGD